MATESALGRRRALAKQRIEAALNKIGEGREFTLPTFSRHGQGMLLVNQLEAIADFLDGGAVPVLENTSEPDTSNEPTDEVTTVTDEVLENMVSADDPITEPEPTDDVASDESEPVEETVSTSKSNKNKKVKT